MSRKNELFSPMGLGTSEIASLGRAISKEKAKNLFSVALHNDIALIDTSNFYGSGDAERLIGECIKNHRDSFFIATKAGLPAINYPRFLSPINQIAKKIKQKLKVPKNYSKSSILNNIQHSLKRLNINSVDLFLLHEPSFDDLQRNNDFHLGLKEIKNRKLSKYIGISTNDKQALEFAIDRGVVDIVQTSLPYSRNSTQTVFEICKKKGIPVIVNQIMRVQPVLKKDIPFLDCLKQHHLSLSDIPKILISYAHDHLDADCILVGTKNENHLIQNKEGIGFLDKDHPLFQIISSIVL